MHASSKDAVLISGKAGLSQDEYRIYLEAAKVAEKIDTLVPRKTGTKRSLGYFFGIQYFSFVKISN